MATNDPIEIELEMLRLKQDQAVMPLIRPMLDAFDKLPNNIYTKYDHALDILFFKIEAICNALEEE